jgi:hypothetical protein
MGNVVFGWPRHTDRVTLSGGAWSASYPRDNMRALPLARVARSATAALADTQVIGTLDKDRPLRLFALCRHNLTVGARYRLRLYQDAARTVELLDTGWLNVWPEVYPFETLEWEDDQWWTGTYSAEEIAGYTWTRPIWLGQLYLARAFHLELDDTTNPAGYVELGLLEVAQGWQPSLNVSYGYQEGWRPRSVGVEALGGGRYFDRRDKPRAARGEIQYLPRDEAMARAFEMVRTQDVDQPMLWFPFPDEPIHWLRTAMLARLADPGLLTYAVARRLSFPFALEEVL